MDNGPARNVNVAQKLQTVGEEVGDPLEISTVRREVVVSCLFFFKRNLIVFSFLAFS